METSLMPRTEPWQELIKLAELQQLQVQKETPDAPPSKRARALRASISPELLRSFDDVTRRGRLGVTVITESGACGGCHLNLPLWLVSVVRTPGEQVHRCPHCGCFLYSLAGLAPLPNEPDRSDNSTGAAGSRARRL